MIVTCPACSARYKINEAKIQGRGAKITCPRCGHKFVVHRDERGMPDAPDDTGRRPVPVKRQPSRDIASIDFSEVGLSWRVRRNGKVAYQFYDLSTLQEYLLDGQIERRDQISYDGRDWTRISDIQNLETHFWEVFQRARRGEVLAPAPTEDEDEDESDAPTTIVGRGSSIASEIRQAVSEQTETPRIQESRSVGGARAAPPSSVSGVFERPARAEPRPRVDDRTPISRPPEPATRPISRPTDLRATPATEEGAAEEKLPFLFGAKKTPPEMVDDDATVHLQEDEEDEGSPTEMPPMPRSAAPPRNPTSGRSSGPAPAWVPPEVPAARAPNDARSRARFSNTASPMPPPPPTVKHVARPPPHPARTVLPYVGLGFIGVLSMGLILFMLLYAIGLFARRAPPPPPEPAAVVAPATPVAPDEEPAPAPEPAPPPPAPPKAKAKVDKPPAPKPQPAAPQPEVSPQPAPEPTVAPAPAPAPPPAPAPQPDPVPAPTPAPVPAPPAAPVPAPGAP